MPTTPFVVRLQERVRKLVRAQQRSLGVGLPRYEEDRVVAEMTRAALRERYSRLPGADFFVQAVRRALEPYAVEVRNAVFYQQAAPFTREEEAEAWVKRASREELLALHEGIERLREFSGWPYEHLAEFVLLGTLKPFKPFVVPFWVPPAALRDPRARRIQGQVASVAVVVPPWLFGLGDRKTWRGLRLLARRAVWGVSKHALSPKQKRLLDLVLRHGPPPRRTRRRGEVGPYWRRLAQEMRTTEVAVRRLWSRIPPLLRRQTEQERRRQSR